MQTFLDYLEANKTKHPVYGFITVKPLTFGQQRELRLNDPALPFYSAKKALRQWLYTCDGVRIIHAMPRTYTLQVSGPYVFWKNLVANIAGTQNRAAVFDTIKSLDSV